MTLLRDSSGTIVLSGQCAVDEAEPLLQLLLETPGAAVDWTRCTGLNTAILQLVIAIRPSLKGPCGDPFIARWFA